MRKVLLGKQAAAARVMAGLRAAMSYWEDNSRPG